MKNDMYINVNQINHPFQPNIRIHMTRWQLSLDTIEEENIEDLREYEERKRADSLRIEDASDDFGSSVIRFIEDILYESDDE